MTANQVNYARVVEERRKNRAQEAETARHNLESESAQRSGVAATLAQVGENRRHNQEQELINWYTTQWQGSRAAAQSAIESANTDLRSREAGIRESELAATIQRNEQTLEEQKRHNLASEVDAASRTATMQQEADIHGFRAISDLATSIGRILTGGGR